MPSPTSTEAAVRALGRSLIHATLLGIACGAADAQAGPGPIHRPEVHCPDGVFPIRMATFQAGPGESVDVELRLERGEFRESWPAVSAAPGWSTITLVVLTYFGGRATELVVEVFGPDGERTWTERVPLHHPEPDYGGLSLDPAYVRVEFPASSWDEAFPVPGIYTLSARRSEHRDRNVSLEPFCGTVATSWVVVSR